MTQHREVLIPRGPDILDRTHFFTKAPLRAFGRDLRRAACRYRVARHDLQVANKERHADHQGWAMTQMNKRRPQLWRSAVETHWVMWYRDQTDVMPPPLYRVNLVEDRGPLLGPGAILDGVICTSSAAAEIVLRGLGLGRNEARRALSAARAGEDARVGCIEVSWY